MLRRAVFTGHRRGQRGRLAQHLTYLLNGVSTVIWADAQRYRGQQGAMPTNPEVEDWFATRKPPAEAAMRRVREIILAADPRMTEYVKYGTV